MKHIRFLSGKEEPICQNPDRLDLWDSPVVVDFAPDDPDDCKLCPQLLMVHNKREFEKEQNQRVARTPMPGPDGNLKRGLIYGLAISSAFYLVLAFLIEWLVL